MRTLSSLALPLWLAACATTPPTTSPVAPLPPPPAVTVPPPVVAAPPAPPSDPCPALGANEVSEDDTPSIAGTSGQTKAGDWLEARGVKQAAFRTWLLAHAPGRFEAFDADTLFDGENACTTLVVGDKREDALVCTLSERTSIMRVSAIALVVRGTRIVSVLEVGYALPAMDWPDKRWLDLQLAFSPDGLEADLHDRGKPGTTLVRAPRECHEHFARYLACEKAHRDGGPLNDVCPETMDASGHMTFGHDKPMPRESPMGGDRIQLAGCADALHEFDQLLKQTGPGDFYAAEFRGDRAFAARSCSTRGRYVWKSGRFVRSP